ncbi:MAG TPA: hypothetical protein VKY92_08415 [Verrucomicrobiae bacterium]|nr:hypothetical protein [Verrucomicrobiae bacterium]
MKVRVWTLSATCVVAVLTGCVERRVVYVPAQQQPAYSSPPPPQAGVVDTTPGAPPGEVHPPPPPPAAEAPLTPPPAPAEGGYAAYAPDYYTWDGNEYVGVVNGNYVYWSGGVWVAAPPAIVFRFHGWERYHPDWHRHAIPYRRRFR